MYPFYADALQLLHREGNGTPLQYSCLENPMDGGAWKAAVHGVAEGRTWLRNFTFTLHFHAVEKEMATHPRVLAWRISGTGEPDGLPSMGSHRVGHDWSDLAAAAVAIRNSAPVNMLVHGFGEHMHAFLLSMYLEEEWLYPRGALMLTFGKHFQLSKYSCTSYLSYQRMRIQFFLVYFLKFLSGYLWVHQERDSLSS